MLCKIAQLLVSVPEAGGMGRRCRAYATDEPGEPQILLDEGRYYREFWPGISPEDSAYLSSGQQFYVALLRHGGMMLHASAVMLHGQAYLFSGPCGTGKSTHTRLWQQVFGPEVRVFNDDKPALRCLDGRWYAFGTPWCGKDGINENLQVPLAGICFLRQSPENRIRRLTPEEAIPRFLSQTAHRLTSENGLRLLSLLDGLLRQVPVYELENRPEPAAARLSWQTMRRGAEEEQQ